MDSTRWDKGILTSNGINIAYESFGNPEDETILLVQGTGVQLIGWPLEFCTLLADAGFRVIRFDHRDVGLSTKLDSLGSPNWPEIFPKIGSCNSDVLPYSLLDMAKDAIGLLDAFKVKKAHVVGASMGGAIAQLMAIHFPDRVMSLTSMMASSGNPARPAGNPEVLQVMAIPPPEKGNTDTLVHHLVRIFQAMQSPQYPATNESLADKARESIERSWYPEGNFRQAAAVIIGDYCDRRAQLKALELATLVIHGENDPVVNIQAGKEVSQAIPGSKFVSIPGMGHDIPDELIPKLGAIILDFIRSIPSF
ncbi:alpha/beta fold hydrolase [Algoriphagus litoralis]|uniref:alpha/beta fold hydrolase n=1 Tax=Algoriphagus litoralis TaxID=2202829 RepID=UPI001300469F|nr:alpha/beta hydrolase [Algoriphagus litoralis]